MFIAVSWTNDLKSIQVGTTLTIAAQVGTSGVTTIKPCKHYDRKPFRYAHVASSGRPPQLKPSEGYLVRNLLSSLTVFIVYAVMGMAKA